MSSLEQQTAGRKERLAQLRSLKRKNENEDQKELVTKASAPAITSRNFDSETRAPRLGYDENPLDNNEETVELVAEEIEREALKKLTEATNSALELDNLQPKRANWDLKRDLGTKMKILEVRTDNAIIKHVRKRLTNAEPAD